MEAAISPTSFPLVSVASTLTNTTDDGQPITLKTEALLIAGFSIFLYGFTCSISIYYYLKFQSIEKEKLQKSFNIGKYDHAKKLFFGILTISSFLEIPNYLGCIALDGPSDCEWETLDNLVFWFFHLISLCGYACCIVIPCVLWSDMINKKDGRLFFSSYPYDSIKRYFQFIIILYFVNMTMQALVTIAYFANDPSSSVYAETPTYPVAALTECILILLLAIGCLYCGIILQVYVHDARLNPTVEMKFLFTLNIILFVIVLSFLGRAVIIIQYAPGISDSFEYPVNYATFTIITRWTPDVFCQLLLVLIMRLSANEVVTKNSVLSYSNNSTITSGRYGGFFTTSESMHKPLLSGENEIPVEMRDDFAQLEENLLPVFKIAEKFRTKNVLSNSEFRDTSVNSGNQERISEVAISPTQLAIVASSPIDPPPFHNETSSYTSSIGTVNLEVNEDSIYEPRLLSFDLRMKE